jgi:hypothetical protein
MASKALVWDHTKRAREAVSVDEKINELCQAIDQLANLVDDVLLEVKYVARKVR